MENHMSKVRMENDVCQWSNLANGSLRRRSSASDMIRMERKGLGFSSLLRQRSMLVHQATHIYTPFTDVAIIQTLSASKLETMDRRNHHLYALVLSSAERRYYLLITLGDWTTRGFSWGKLIMDLDWWEHLIVLIYLDVVLKGESVLDSLSRLPSAGLHQNIQNLRFTSCLKKCLILHHSNIVRLLHVLRQKTARSSWNHRMVIPAIWSILIHYPSPIHPESSLVRSGEIPKDAKQPDAPWRS